MGVGKCRGKLRFVEINFPVYGCNVEMEVKKYIVFFGVWLVIWKWKWKS